MGSSFDRFFDRIIYSKTNVLVMTEEADVVDRLYSGVFLKM